MSSTEMVTSKTVVNSILYTYDKDGNLTKKTIAPTGEEPFTYFYETNNGNTVAKFVAGGKTVTCHSKTDSFGRKVFDEIRTGTGFISRQFSYYTGNITDEHVENEKLKSTPTTQLVSQTMLSSGRMLAYEYDALVIYTLKNYGAAEILPPLRLFNHAPIHKVIRFKFNFSNIVLKTPLNC